MPSLRGLPVFVVALSLLFPAAIFPNSTSPQLKPRTYPPEVGNLPAVGDLRAAGDLPAAGALPSEDVSAELQPPSQAPLEISDLETYTRLVYQTVRYSGGEYNWDIMSAAGISYNFTPQNLTNHSSYDITPRLSPDGGKIAFASDRAGNYEIYTMNWDGSGLLRLTNTGADKDDAYPIWSPAGNRIAFTSHRDGNSEIYVMNADGSGQTRLTADGAADFAPVWSPDGQKIAWIRAVGQSSGVILLADADGSNVQVLSPPLAYLDQLAWRPGVGMLGFTYDSNGDLWFDIGFINADGTGLRPVKLGSYLRDMWMGSWVADGSMLITQIAYNTQFDITGSDMYRIYISDGSIFQSFASFVDPFYPHVQLLDDDPPISAVHPLPEYSRASGFPVSWSSEDVGVAGVHLVAVQTREGQTGTWTNWWSTFPDQGPVPYSGVPGREVFFRSSASDSADNVEPWPPGDGDAHTTLYQWQMTGQVMDSRGRPVPLAPLGITPDAANSLQSGLDGSYLAYLIAEGDHRLTASHAGYGDLPALRQGVNEDEILDIVLPPQVNLVTNGGFENTQDPLAGWSITGTLPVTTTSGRSGEAAIRLGELCSPACLSPAEQPYAAHYYASPNMDYAPDGTLHIVWNRTEHAARSPAGVWSYEIIPGEFGTFGDVDSYKPLVKVDALGTLHVIVQGDTQAYYVQKPAGGEWSQPYELGDAWQTQMTADSAGGVHLTYYCYSSCDHGAGIFYLHRSPAGMWQTPIYIWNIWTQLPALTVGTDGIVHLLYRDGNLRYRQVRPDGTLTNPEGIGSGSAVALAMDPAGVLHALGNDSSRGPAYYSRQPSGEWTKASYLPVPSSNALQMDVDSSGGVHISVVHSDTTLVYLYKPAGSSGFEIHDVVGNLGTQINHAGLAVTAEGRVALAWSDINGQLNVVHTQIAAERRSSAARQVLQVPAGMNEPTLSLLYNFGAIAGWQQSHYKAWLQSENGDVTTVLSSTQASSWDHVWVDMTDWAGEAVTLTLELHQQAGEPALEFLVDAVTLGEWLTPVIDVVSPPQMDAGSSQAFTISGENFTDPVVRLGEVELDQVVWLDEHTLQASLPATFLPGAYDLWVVNSGGQAAVLPRGFQVGKALFLPRLSK